VVVTQGVLLRIFVLEGQRHHGELLYDWLLRRAREMGITGGAAFREIAGYGHHERLHERSFFELAGDLPVEVAFAMTQSDSQNPALRVPAHGYPGTPQVNVWRGEGEEQGQP
jgi:PII-like signaling protein